MEITKYSICHPMSKLRNKSFIYIDLVLEKTIIGWISFLLNKPTPNKKFQKTLMTPYYQHHFKICSKIFKIFIKKVINYHMGNIIMSLIGPNKCPHQDLPKRFSHKGLYCNILQNIAIYCNILNHPRELSRGENLKGLWPVLAMPHTGDKESLERCR